MFDSDQGILPDVVHDTLRKWLWVPWMVIIVLVFGTLIQLVAWWFDTESPFKLLSYTAPAVHAGGVLEVDGKVVRDLNRNCSLVGSRYIIDSAGTRYDIGMASIMTPDAIRSMDAIAPGELHQKFLLPYYIAPGKAVITTTMQYSCNPLQEILHPISVEMTIPFEVLP